MNNEHYPRDMVGYGANPPQAKWPRSARLAVQFVINYEEGGENNILHGDKASEAFLSRSLASTVARPAPYEHGIDLRIRASRWHLAAVRSIQPHGYSGHGFCCRYGISP